MFVTMIFLVEEIAHAIALVEDYHNQRYAATVLGLSETYARNLAGSSLLIL